MTSNPSETNWFYAVGVSLLMVTVGVAYADVLGYEYLSGFDDVLYLFDRPEMRGWWSASWRHRLLTPDLGYPVPVPTGVYAFAKWAFGDAFPHYLHGLNLFLHLVNTLLVASIAARWTEDRRIGVMAAAAWALHPLCVETVSWITDLKILVFATCALGAVLLADKIPVDRERWFGWIDAAAVGLMLIAFGARPEALVIPGLMWAVLWRKSDFRTALRQVAVVLAASVVITAIYLPVAMTGQSQVVTGLPANTMGPRRLITRVFRALEISVHNSVWPLDLQPGYFRKTRPEWLDALPGVAIFVVLAGAGLWLYRRGQRRVVAAMILAGFAYLPYSQLKALPRLTADTYMYLPLVGLVIAAAAAAVNFVDWVTEYEGVRRHRIVWALLTGFGIWLAAMTVVTVSQVDRWRNTQSLWIPYAVKNSSNWKPFTYAGKAYFDAEEYAMAASTYEQGLRAFRLHKRYPPLMITAFEQAGAPKKAWKLTLEALRRESDPDPEFYNHALRFIAAYPWAAPAALSPPILQKAVDQYVAEDHLIRVDGLRRRLMIIFAATGRVDLAEPFLRWELEHISQPSCAVWIAAEAAPRESNLGADLPAKPARCEGVQPPAGLLGEPEK